MKGTRSFDNDNSKRWNWLPWLVGARESRQIKKEI